MTRIVFIYGLVDPVTDDVRYVGKSVDPLSRFAQHLRDQTATRRGRWIRSLLAQDLRPGLMLLEVVTGDWQVAERQWIAAYRAAGGDITNHTDGGDGISGLDAEARARLSAIMTQRLADPEVRARIFTPERAAAISRALTGRPKTAAHVAKLSQNQPGRTLTEEHRAKISAALIGNQYALGLRHSDATKARLAEASRGNHYSLGRVLPYEEKLQRSLNGRQAKTAEHRQRISAGLRRSWEAGRGGGGVPSAIAWPPYEEVEARVAKATTKAVATELGVKPGTLSAFLYRNRKARVT